MDIAETAAVLNDLYAQQYKDNLAANEANRRLADEKISYQNEARGTYYSGQPTWERAQNAITYADKANDISIFNLVGEIINIFGRNSIYFSLFLKVLLSFSNLLHLFWRGLELFVTPRMSRHK